MNLPYKTLYIEPDEEVINVINRLHDTEEDLVVLVVPTGSLLLSSIINLRLLKEELNISGQHLALVSADATGRSLAHQVGFLTYDTVQAAEAGIVADMRAVIKEEKKIVSHDERVARALGRIHQESGTHLDEKGDIHFHRNHEFDAIETHDVGSHKIIDRNEERTVQRAHAFDELFGDHHEQELGSKDQSGVRRDESTVHAVQHKAKPRLPVWVNAKTLGIAGGAFVIFLFFATFIFPRATLHLNIYTNEQEMSVPFALAEEVKSVEKKDGVYRIPATWQSEEKEATITFTTTGKKNVGDKAQGTMVVYNRTGKAVTIPAGTQFVKDGRAYIVKATISAPGAIVSDFGELIPGKTSFNVEAIEGGTAYNIQPGRFAIIGLVENANLVYGMSEESFGGGSDREARVVTDEDMRQASERAREEMNKKIEEGLGIAGDLVFVRGLAKTDVLSEVASKKADEEADEFTVTMKARLSYLAFARPDFDQVYREISPLSLSDQLSVIGNGGYRSSEFSVSQFDPDKKTAQVTGRVKVLVGAKINEGFIRSRVGGLSVQEVREELKKYPDVELEGISFFPPGLVSSIPVSESGIKVRVNYVEKE